MAERLHVILHADGRAFRHPEDRRWVLAPENAEGIITGKSVPTYTLAEYEPSPVEPAQEEFHFCDATTGPHICKGDRCAGYTVKEMEAYDAGVLARAKEEPAGGAGEDGARRMYAHAEFQYADDGVLWKRWRPRWIEAYCFAHDEGARSRDGEVERLKAWLGAKETGASHWNQRYSEEWHRAEAAEKRIRELEQERDGLRDESARNHAKWWSYEQDYILPCFSWAKECSIDLESLVHEKAGNNCVALLVAELKAAKEAAEARNAELEQRQEAWLPILRALTAWRATKPRIVSEVEDHSYHEVQIADALDRAASKLRPEGSK